ncbi:transposase [Pseudomonas sp. 65/3-MNA-CIBAN-0223]|uniref:IS66 family transposase n=1 Tax=Pseudomonas sp. 65/3-MNA-CIBAN-0223 TaxID=3140476 RepID=UPI00332FB239
MKTGDRQIRYDYSKSRAQNVSTPLLDGYHGYDMTDDYAGYKMPSARSGRAFSNAMPMYAVSSWKQTKSAHSQDTARHGTARHGDITLNLIKKLYGIECDFQASDDAEPRIGRYE